MEQQATPREAERSRDDEGEKLGSLCWSATSRLKEQIRGTAHQRTTCTATFQEFPGPSPPAGTSTAKQTGKQREETAN